jgi:hypothetical protein
MQMEEWQSKIWRAAEKAQRLSRLAAKEPDEHVRATLRRRADRAIIELRHQVRERNGCESGVSHLFDAIAEDPDRRVSVPDMCVMLATPPNYASDK